MDADRHPTVVLTEPEHNGRNGDLGAASDPGTTAVLHGMVSMLSEVLEGLDHRLGRVEETMARAAEDARVQMEGWRREASRAAQAPPPPPDPRFDDVLVAIGDLARRLERLESTTDSARSGADVLSAAIVGGVGERLEASEAAVAATVQAAVADLIAHAAAPAPGPDERMSSLMADVIAALDTLTEAVAAGADRAETVQASVGDVLDVRLATAAAQTAEQLDLLTDRIGELLVVPRAGEERIPELFVAMGRRLDDIESALGALRPSDDLAGRLDARVAPIEEQLTWLERSVNDAGAAVRDEVASASQEIAAQLASVVEGLRSELTGVGDGIRAELGALGADGAQTRADLDELGSQLRAGQEAATVIGTAVSGMAERFAGLEEAITDGTARAVSGVAELRQAVDPLPAVLDAVVGLETRLASVHGLVEAANDREEAASRESLDVALAQLADIGGTVKWLAEQPPVQADAVRSANEELGARLADVERTVRDVTAAAAADLRTAVGDAQDGLALAVADLDERVRRLRPVDDSLYAAIVSVGDRLASTDGVIERAVSGLRDVLLARLDELSVDAMSASIAELGSAQAAAAGAMLSALGDLDRHLIDLDAGLTSDRGMVAESVEDLGSRLFDAIGSLSSAMAPPPSTDESLRTGVTAIEARLAGVEEGLQGNREELERALRRLVQAIESRPDGTEPVLAAVARVTDELVRLESAVEAGTARGAESASDAVAELVRRLTELEVAMQTSHVERTEDVLASVAELKERMRKPRGIDDSIRAAIGGVSDKVERLEGLLTDRHAVTGDSMHAVGEALDEMRERIEVVAASVQRLRDGVAADIAAVPERISGPMRSMLEDTSTRVEGMQGALDLLGQRLGQSNMEVADDVRASLTRVNELIGSVAAIGTQTGAISDGIGRLVDDSTGRTQALLDAVAASSKESHERLRALHASLVRRMEAAVAGRPEGDDGVVTALLGRLDQLAGSVSAVRSSVEALPAGVESTLASVATEITEQQDAISSSLDRFRDAVESQSTTLARVQESVQGLGGSVDGGLERLRSSVGEGLVGIGRRTAASMKQLDRILALMEDDRRGIEGLQALCQSLASATEQSGSLGGRVADLVLESRSAMRGDIERLESSVHLENVKQQQQSQAHLAQAVATIGDVVERESVVLSQRMAAVTAAVETIRTVLHAHIEDTSRPARTGGGTNGKPAPQPV